MTIRRAIATLMFLLPVAARAADEVKPLARVAGVSSAVFSPDSRVLMTIGEESRQCHYWSLETGEEVNRFGDAPRFAAFSADGRRVLAVGRDHSVRVFDATTGKALRRIAGTRPAVSAAAINADGSRVAVAPVGPPFDPVVYDAETGKELATLVGHDGPVGAIACDADVPGVVTAQAVKQVGADGVAVDAAAIDARRAPLSHLGRPHATAVGPGVVRVYTAGPRGTRLDREIATRFVPIVVGRSPEGSVVWAASADAFGAWDVKSGDAIDVAKHAGPITPAGRLTADRRVGVRPGLGSAVLVDAVTGAEVRALAGPIEGTVACHAFSPDSKRLVLATSKPVLFDRRAGDVEPGPVYVFDVASGKQVARFAGHAKPIVQVCVSPGGSHVFSRDAGGTLMVWGVP